MHLPFILFFEKVHINLKPFYDLLQKNTPWNWTSEHEFSLTKLKSSLTSDTELRIPNTPYSTQNSDLFVTYTNGFNMHTGRPNHHSVKHEDNPGKLILDPIKYFFYPMHLSHYLDNNGITSLNVELFLTFLVISTIITILIKL